MPRPQCGEFEGAIDHPPLCTATAGQTSCIRGDRREPIYRDDANRRRFLDTLGEPCAKTDGQESGEAKAERRVREQPARPGWREAHLGRRRQSDPARVGVARWLRGETTTGLLAGR